MWGAESQEKKLLAHVVLGSESESWRLSAEHEAMLQADSSLD